MISYGFAFLVHCNSCVEVRAMEQVYFQVLLDHVTCCSECYALLSKAAKQINHTLNDTKNKGVKISRA